MKRKECSSLAAIKVYNNSLLFKCGLGQKTKDTRTKEIWDAQFKTLTLTNSVVGDVLQIPCSQKGIIH